MSIIDFDGDVWEQIQQRVSERAHAGVAARVKREPKRRDLHLTHVAHFTTGEPKYHRLRPPGNGWYRTVCGRSPGDNGGIVVPVEFRRGRPCETCYLEARGRHG
jgi:hypothetical protein